VLEKVRTAASSLDAADAALRAGDFAKYGDLERKARQEIKQALKGSSK
jgi:hypothetical protein